MARTPLLTAVQRLVREHRVATTTGRPVEAVREQMAAQRSSGISRRQLLVAGSAVAAGSLLAIRNAQAGKPGGNQPRIVIVGGGIAGLTAALTLSDRGYSATIYEAMSRIGGRMLSDSSAPSDLRPACGTCHGVNRPAVETWLDGQVTDVFGELIDSNHTTMLSLANRFNLPLIDLLACEPPGSTETYFFNGSYYSKAQADLDIIALQKKLQADLSAAGYPTSYNRSKPGGRALDNMSIYDWIETRVPGGHTSPMGRLLDVAYNIEFGAETTDQTALSLLYLLGYGPQRNFSVFGVSDERYRIAQGVDALPYAIANAVSPTCPINYEHRLEAIVERADGTYELTFDAGRRVTVIADVVIMTVPFAAMGAVDYSNAGFDALKTQAIQELGKGHNGKLHAQFNMRLWNALGPWGISGGSSYSDTGYQVTWEATRGQAGQRGILVQYTGGNVADAQRIRHSYATSGDARVDADVQTFLAQIQPVFPGLAALYTGRAASCMPHVNPYWQCSYSYWRVGQCQKFAGYERVRQGNVFFAGEHTSLDFQGWMEGAASEGARAGNEVLAAI